MVDGRALMLYYAMLCYANDNFFRIDTYKSPSTRLNTYRNFPKLPEYLEIPHSHERFDATCKCTIDLPSRIRMLFHAQNAKKSALHGASQLRDSLASTIGDGQSRLQISTRIHQTPFVFPFLARRIETLFPWLIESFEPRTIESH